MVLRMVKVTNIVVIFLLFILGVLTSASNRRFRSAKISDNSQSRFGPYGRLGIEDGPESLEIRGRGKKANTTTCQYFSSSRLGTK